MSTRATTSDKTVNVSKSKETKKIVIPDGMSYKDAREWLARKEADEETVIALSETFDAFITEGAVAFAKALDEIYGWTQGLSEPMGFWGRQPPQLMTVKTGPRDSDVVQVPWGRIGLPGVDGWVAVGWAFVEMQMAVLNIQAQVKKKHAEELKNLFIRTKELVRQTSVYRGQAFYLKAPNLEEVSSLEDFNPKFMNLGTIPGELILPHETEKLVDVNLFTPIYATEQCRKLRIPLKRGVLLAGPYGTGKTLTAWHTAKLCLENNWTFIYLTKVKDLAYAVRFAAKYQPCVIFAEDIDSMLGDQKRDQATNDILNVIDGMDTKTHETIVVLTTNHVENVNVAFLRPGRLDAVIHIGPPDAAAATALVYQYARGQLDPNTNLDEAATLLAGKIPAVIREVVERAKLAAVARHARYGSDTKITGDDLVVATRSMFAHLELLSPKTPDKRSDMEKAADRLVEGFTHAMTLLPEETEEETPPPPSTKKATRSLPRTAGD